MTNTKAEYAQGIISLQISVNYKGTPCHVLIKDPKLRQGYMWPGGYFFPSGNLYESADDIQYRQTGIKLKPDSLKLRTIVYSRTAVNGLWIGNHAFTADAREIDSWNGVAKGFEVILVKTDSLKGPLEKVVTIKGKDNSEVPQWAINDGPHIGWTIAKEAEFKKMGLNYLQEIPVVVVPNKCKSLMRQGFALNVGNVILPHNYKGTRGYVCIENYDRTGKALMGGKVEGMTNAASTNIDASSCVIAEAAQEIGVPLRGVSIIGCALTPLDLLSSDATNREDGLNSILTTSILAAPINPRQLDEAIEKPERFIPKEERGKIKGIYFLSRCEWDDLLKYGKMRTPDMVPLARQEQMGSPALRPSLESIVVLNTKPKFKPTKDISETYIFPNR